jgi:hypothetical protein
MKNFDLSAPSQVLRQAQDERYVVDSVRGVPIGHKSLSNYEWNQLVQRSLNKKLFNLRVVYSHVN